LGPTPELAPATGPRRDEGERGESGNRPAPRSKSNRNEGLTTAEPDHAPAPTASPISPPSPAAVPAPPPLPTLTAPPGEPLPPLIREFGL
jgi:hypothetical protein